MSALPTETRIVKLIPRLASNFDGEVVATARAIGNTLKSAGRDWHDIAQAFSAFVGKPAPRQEPSSRNAWSRTEEAAPLWSELTVTRRSAWLSAIHGRYWLSIWEADFVADMLARDHASLHRVSSKQEIALNRIIARAFSIGVRP